MMPNIENDWSLKCVKAAEALAMLNGPPNWGDIKVAHIDTGVTDHTCLGNWVNLNGGVNYLEPGKKPIDPLNRSAAHPGHGTRTCSVLTGFEAGQPSGIPAKYTGVAPKLPVVPYRVTDTVLAGSPEVSSNIALAIRHAVYVTNCQIISISLGWPTANNTDLGNAIDHAYENGVIVVAAGGQFIESVCYPGKYWRAIAAGGYKKRKTIYHDYGDLNSRSNTGVKMNHFIDVWAPADPVYRADENRNPPVTPSTYSDGDGTSFAAPHVSAAAAMWLLHHGNALTAKYGNELWMRVEAFRMVLKLSAQDLNAHGYIGFAHFKPARSITKIRSKQSPAPGQFEKITTGGLDIEALLNEALPDGNKLRKSVEAVHQSG